MSHFYAKMPTVRGNIKTARGFKSTGISTQVMDFHYRIETRMDFDPKAQANVYTVLKTNIQTGESKVLAQGFVDD